MKLMIDPDLITNVEGDWRALDRTVREARRIMAEQEEEDGD